jgi:hypothetical protein
MSWLRSQLRSRRRLVRNPPMVKPRYVCGAAERRLRSVRLEMCCGTDWCEETCQAEPTRNPMRRPSFSRLLSVTALLSSSCSLRGSSIERAGVRSGRIVAQQVVKGGCRGSGLPDSTQLRNMQNRENCCLLAIVLRLRETRWVDARSWAVPKMRSTKMIELQNLGRVCFDPCSSPIRHTDCRRATTIRPKN